MAYNDEGWHEPTYDTRRLAMESKVERTIKLTPDEMNDIVMKYMVDIGYELLSASFTKDGVVFKVKNQTSSGGGCSG